ncbi:two-partner secretion domain-containing protein [Nostoc sp.]|uniref:two-partner secretion domain-containing protein n=1 Tax=Nostoc sp. TaxID=1180 RepID=UPI003FA5E896
MSTTGYAYAFLSTLTIGFLSSALLLPAIAQVTSDGTTNTIVNPNGNNFTILNGIQKGNNLFHSFSNFSVPTSGSARFDLINTPNITTIFSRVTGGNVSNIDGLISTLNSNNPVSLFLMNPAGIVFGANARLDISGSFVGTTANSIKFSDGVDFSAVNANATPLLTMSVPVGLQMGSNPAPITVQGNGHQLTAPNPTLPPIRSATPTGLEVQPGQTLALIGGNISLTGGTLTAEQGQVAIASVGGGRVDLTASSQGWDFDYSGVSSFRDIQLSQQSMLDASGIGSGRIQVQGANISLKDGSTLLIESFGLQPGGGIQVRATESFQIQGSTPDGSIASGLGTILLGASEGGTIMIESPRLSLQQGGWIYSDTYSTGSSGMITVKAIDSMEVNGLSPQTFGSSGIYSHTYGSGSAGAIALSTRYLTLVDGGTINSTTFDRGNAGNVTLNVDGTLSVMGVEPTFLQPSNISSGTIGTGNAGNLTLNTRHLIIQGGARISSSTLARGNAGSAIVNATESVEVQGKGPSTLSPSTIESAATIVDPALQQRFNLPLAPSGTSGNVIINTPQLSITDGALVSVSNQGVGNAGDLLVNADAIRLDRQGGITASTQSGEGGNINLQANSLILRHNSTITATASGTGNGGNLTINSPIILGLENSDIIANAFQGKGGNIDITSQGIFGLKYRPQLTRENDITASSQFGVSGTVQINTIGVDPNSGLVELPTNVTDSSQQIASGCSANQGSRFVATGRGGVPPNPNQQVRSDVYDGLHLRTWSDIRNLTAYRKTQKVQAQIPPTPEVLIQATSWRRNAQGKIELVADKSPTYLQQPLTCAALRKI